MVRIRRLQTSLVLAAVLALLVSVQRAWVPNLGATVAPSGGAAVMLDAAARSERQLEQALRRTQQRPTDAQAHSQLGLLYLGKARSSGNPAYYSAAEAPLRRALEIEDGNADALVGLGALALARHDFDAAWQWGSLAVAASPNKAAGYGVLGDAALELGRYDEAFGAFDRMADLRPDLNAYARLAQARELIGDIDGATAALDLAIDAGGVGTESVAWARAQLGQLWLDQGQLDRAERAYQETLHRNPEFAPALFGLGRVAVARGDTGGAIARLSAAAVRLPLPEYLAHLEQAYLAASLSEAAATTRELLYATDRLHRANGIATDLEMTKYQLETGGDSSAVGEMARQAYAARPNVGAADTLGWALYHSGDCENAQTLLSEALRLGTRDAAMHFHAGMIAHCLDDTDGARDHLATALAINPYFSTRYAPLARDLLASLGVPVKGH